MGHLEDDLDYGLKLYREHLILLYNTYNGNEKIIYDLMKIKFPNTTDNHITGELKFIYVSGLLKQSKENKMKSNFQEDCFENEKNHGFHDGSRMFNQIKEDQCMKPACVFYRKIALLHTEISELVEAFRKNELFKQCNKPIDLNCAEEELADINIRLQTLASFLATNLNDVSKVKHEYNKARSHLHGKNS